MKNNGGNNINKREEDNMKREDEVP